MKCAFIFPGQGSQSIGMGADFYENFDEAKQMFEIASNAIGLDLKELLFTQNENLNLTQYTQPAIFLVSLIALKIFQKECGIKPIVCFGHSLGEVSAVVASGACEFASGVNLVHKRGALMSKACDGKDAGMMVVMGLSDSVLEQWCAENLQNGKNIWCANYNGEGQIVLAGSKKDLSEAESSIKALGAKRALLLPMSVASHCPMLQSCVDEFKNLLDSTFSNNLDSKIISNATLESYDSVDKAKELLCLQLTKPVLYKQSVLKVDENIDCFIEFGNGSVLGGLNKRLSNKPTYSISDSKTLKNCLNELGF